MATTTDTLLPDIPALEEVAAGWGRRLIPSGCDVCGHVYLNDEAVQGICCPNCAQSRLEAQPAFVRIEPPELVIPFKKQSHDLSPILAGFTRNVWLHFDDFTPAKLVQRCKPLFFPMWLVDSDVVGSWEAEVGFDYEVKSFRESYGDSGWVSDETINIKTRWEPRVGLITRHYENIPVPALTDQQDLAKMTGAYHMEQAIPYEPALVDNISLRVPDIQPREAWDEAKVLFAKSSAQECQQAVGAQYIRSFALRAEYRALHWTQLLQPLYITHYSDDQGKLYPIYINGETGEVNGMRLVSQRKGWIWAGIIAGVALLLFIVGSILAMLHTTVAAFASIGALLITTASVLLLIALIPALYPWFWNRQQWSERTER